MVKISVVFESGHEDEYEHGLMLLLNATDVEMQVQAIFMNQALSAMTESMLKKIGQLALYEVPTFTLAFHQAIPEAQVITYECLTKLLSKSEHVLFV